MKYYRLTSSQLTSSQLTPSQHDLANIHKLPPKLLTLLNSVEHSSVVGFGKTQQQRDYMLLTAVIASQDCVFAKALTQELKAYFLTLRENLSVSIN